MQGHGVLLILGTRQQHRSVLGRPGRRRGQILWTPCGLRNFARMGRRGGYGAIAGGADGPPLPKQPRRHYARSAMTQSLAASPAQGRREWD
jgi:hypothetical protein